MEISVNSIHCSSVPTGSYRGSHWLIQRVPSSSSSGWLGRGGGREPLIWCLILTLNSPSSPTRPSHYVVGDIAGSEQLVRVPGTNTGHVRTRHYMCGYTHLSFSVSSNPTTFDSEKMVLKFITIVVTVLVFHYYTFCSAKLLQ